MADSDDDSEDSDSEDSDSEDSDSEDSDSKDSDSDDYDSDSDDSDNETDSDDEANEDSDDEANEDSDDEANDDSDDEANKDSHDKANHVDLNNIPVSGHYNHLESVKEPNPYDTRTGRTGHTQDTDSDDSDSDDYVSDSDYSDNESDSDDSIEDSDEANDGSDDEDSENSGDEANQYSDEDAEIANVRYGNSEGIVNSSNYVEGNNSQELNSRDSKNSDYYYMRNMDTLARALPDPYVFSPIHSSHNHVDLNDILVSGHYNHLEGVEEPNPYDARTGRTAHTPKQRPVHSSSYTPYDHYGHNNLLVSGHNVPEIGPEEVYSDYETHEYW